MKPFVLAVLLASVTLAPAVAQRAVVPAADPNRPVLGFETEVIDIGSVETGAGIRRDFKLKNVGKSPLLVTAVVSQCTCITVISSPQSPIAPGQSGVITVKYDNSRPGRFSKTLTVTSNGGDRATTLTLKGDVKAKPAS